MPALITALELFAPDRLRELVVEPARTIAPTAHERAALEAALAANVRLVKVDVPWPRAVENSSEPTPMDGSCHTIELFGEPLRSARITEVLAAVEELGFGFDSFELDRKRRLLGRDPGKALARAVLKRGGHPIRLFRDGGERSVEVADGSHREVPTYRTTLVLDGFGERVDRTFAWLASFLERFTVSHGVCAPTNHVLVPLSWLDATSHKLGWFTVFGPHHETILPRAELAALASVGAEVRELSRNVVVLWTSTPDGSLDEARARAIDAILTPIVERGVARKLGYDFDEVMQDTLGPALEHEGFMFLPKRWANWRRPFLASWVQRRHGVDRSIDVSLDGLATVPRLSYWLRRSEVGDFPVGGGRQIDVTSYLPTMGHDHTAASRGALERSALALAERIPAYFDP